MSKELLDSLAAEIEQSEEGVLPESSEAEAGEVEDGSSQPNRAAEEAEEETQVGEETEDDAGEERQPDPSIAPPNSMSNEEVEYFNTLPPEMQEFIVRRESNRDADFSRTHTDLAAQKDEIAAKAAELDTLRDQLSQQLSTQAQQLNQIVASEVTPPDPNLRHEDPEAYDDQMAAYVHNLHVQKQAESKLREVQQQQLIERKRTTAKQLAEVRRLIPEFNDAEKAGQLQQRIFNFAQTAGYSSEELANVNAKDVVVLHKAMLYDDSVKSGRKSIETPKRPQAPKSMRASASKGRKSKARAEYDRLGKRLKEGDDRAMAGIFEMQLRSEGMK